MKLGLVSIEALLFELALDEPSYQSVFLPQFLSRGRQPNRTSLTTFAVGSLFIALACCWHIKTPVLRSLPT